MVSIFLFMRNFVLAVSLLCAWSAQANDEMVRLYTVFGIRVDETAATANEARTLAIAKAENEAWQRLVVKLTSNTDASNVLPPPGRLISDYILGFDVVEEKNSKVRYVATINVSFDPKKMQALFTERNISYVLFPAPPTLIIPIWIADGSIHLWEDSNLFRTAWQNADRQNRLTDVRLPEGTLEEQLNVTAEAMLEEDFGQFIPDFGAHYGAHTVERVVAEGTYDLLGNLTELVVTAMAEHSQQEQYVLRVSINPGQEAALELDRIVSTILDDRDREWKRLALTSGIGVNALELVVKVASGAEWAEMTRSLSTVPLVQAVEPQVISFPESQLAIRYQGTFDQLQIALKTRGLSLVASKHGWILIRAH